MIRSNDNDETVQHVLDEYAADVQPQYQEHAQKFRELNRWTGADPLVLIADAAGSATGLDYMNVVKPNVEQFRETFVESGKVTSLDDLAGLEDDPEFENQFTVGRPKLVYDIAQALLNQAVPGSDDLDVLRTWAESANPDEYRDDPVGEVTGVGLATFQYLRMIAGADTVKPDIQAERFIEELESEHPSFEVDSSSKTSVLESCQWLAEHSTYSMIEIDQIAWWTFTDTDERPSTH